MKNRWLVIVVLTGVILIGAVGRAATSPVDISGTWTFSVDLEDGGHGDPTFVFTQVKEELSGSYDGPLGKHKVAGTVKDNKAVFGFEFSNEEQTRRATYTGVIESATKMSGTVEFTGGPRGKWTAVKK
ncbi:MAG TPA: hypothetical protein VNS63_27480 [Blastocatellia bacterium]|nr:hypothetical protein [Blastocatellia bacterium]